MSKTLAGKCWPFLFGLKFDILLVDEKNMIKKIRKKDKRKTKQYSKSEISMGLGMRKPYTYFWRTGDCCISGFFANFSTCCSDTNGSMRSTSSDCNTFADACYDVCRAVYHSPDKDNTR